MQNSIQDTTIANRKSKANQAKAWFLLTVFSVQLFFPYASIALSQNATMPGGPVAASADEYVDMFTGNFHYSVPLMVVPGPNGEVVNISANYHSDVTMDEAASWIGLGWEYNPGEISRQICGVGDDIKSKTQHGTLFRDLNNLNDFGSNARTMDITGTYFGRIYESLSGSYKKDEAELSSYFYDFSSGGGRIIPFRFPALDKYFVSGQGIGGQIRPYNTQFIFENSTAYNYNNDPAYDIHTTDYNTTRDNPIQGYNVIYYTNGQINSGSVAADFVDYKNSYSRSSTDFDMDGIGAFQVTSPSGLTYHYSLPVYNLEQKDISFALKNTYSENVVDVNFDGRMSVSYKGFREAVSWKLTAITGNDYVDNNNNHMADGGDGGYWIAYDYTLWNGSFGWSQPFFNYKQDFGMSTQPYQTEKNFSASGENVYIPNFNYAPTGYKSRGIKQQYYLNYIKTATHTAYFIKDLRLDEHGNEKMLVSTAKPSPSLKLSKIILVRNSSASLFTNSGSFPSDSRFDFTNCYPAAGNLVHVGTYYTNKTYIDKTSLKTVSFNTDYSLCPKLHNNINNSFSTSTVKMDSRTGAIGGSLDQYYFMDAISSDLILFKKYNINTSSNFSTTDAANSGKLSLKEIVCTEQENSQIFPSYKFTYSSYNAGYDPEREDFFGYAPSGGAQYIPTAFRYPGTTGTDGDWAITNIKTPLGAEINISYESDNYNDIYQEGAPVRHDLVEYVSSGTAGALPGINFIFRANTSSFSANDQLFMPYLGKCSNESNYHCLSAQVNILSASVTSYGINFTTNPSLSSAQLICTSPASDMYLGYSPSMLGYGYLIHPQNIEYGGGTRVHTISIKEGLANTVYTSNYVYGDGTCSQNPAEVTTVGSYLCNNYKLSDRYAGNPTVGYKNVTSTLTDNTGKQHGSTKYEFIINTSSPYDNVSLTGTSSSSHPISGPLSTGCGSSGYGNALYYTKIFQLNLEKRVTNNIGTLRKRSVYDNGGNLISYTYYAYKLANKISQLMRSNVSVPGFFPHGTSIYCNGQSPKVAVGSVNGIFDSYSLTSNLSTYTQFVDSIQTYKDGITTTQKILERDKYTGAPTKVLLNDPTKGGILTTTEFAYTGNSLMGPASNNTGVIKQDMSSVSKSLSIRYPIRFNGYGKPEADMNQPGLLLGGSKTTYQATANYRGMSTDNYFYTNSATGSQYLPTEQYELVTDDHTPETQTTLNWRKIYSSPCYQDINHHALLEAKGLNDRYGKSSKMGYGNNEFKIAECADANLNSYTFCGFENPTYTVSNSAYLTKLDGEVIYNGWADIKTTPYLNGSTAINSHSGNKVVHVSSLSGGIGPGFFTKNFNTGRTYHASVWVHNSSAATAALNASLDGSVNGTPSHTFKSIAKSDPSNITAGDWTLLNLEIDVPTGYTGVNGSSSQNDLRFYLTTSGTDAIFDDLSIHPVDSPISGYVYDYQTGQLTAQLDNDNLATFYTYDQGGRVISVSKETKNGVKKVTETTYHFGRP